MTLKFSVCYALCLQGIRLSMGTKIWVLIQRKFISSNASNISLMFSFLPTLWFSPHSVCAWLACWCWRQPTLGMLGIVIIGHRSAGAKSALHLPPQSGARLSPCEYTAVLLQRGQFSHKYSQKTPHSSPVRARYGMSFVGSSIWLTFCHSSCNYSCNIWPRHNGTWLYFSTPNHSSCRLVAIGETVILVPYHFAKSPQVIRRSSTRLRVPDLQISCLD